MSERSFKSLPMIITWGDCDAAGITYYAKSFDWFTNGRMHFLKENGLPYMPTFHDHAITMVVLKAECQYRRMLKPGEDVILETGLSSLTRSRVTFDYILRKADDSIAVEGSTEHAFVDRDGKPFNLSKRYPELWQNLNRISR